MQNFWSGEFELDQGDYISVQVEAQNQKGWSRPSSWNFSGATVQKVPTMMNPPNAERVDGSGDGDVMLTWNLITDSRRSGGVEDTDAIEYVMQWAEKRELGDGEDYDEADWTYLLGEPDNDDADANSSNADFPLDDQGTFTHDDFTKSDGTTLDEPAETKMVYKIAARTKWGTGPWSKPLEEVENADNPDAVSNIKVNDAGMIRITWFDPVSGGGSAIKSYEVQILDGSGKFVTPSNDCRQGTNDIKESTDPAT